MDKALLNLDPNMLTTLDITTLVISLVFSIVGYAYYRYGKKESTYFLICGIALMFYPYFISGMWPLIIVGLVLMGIPFLMAKM